MSSSFEKTCLLFVSLLVIYSQALIAQSDPPLKDVVIASPNASSLGKFADIPVNNHTGIPSINIPIHTINYGPLKLQVGLSYHASGIRVEEASSWVGNGWVLDAGGVVVRTVRGFPDDPPAGGRNTADFSSGPYFGYLTDKGVSNYLFQTRDDPNQICPRCFADRRDGEPDLFTFNFAGYTGKFYFNDDQTVRFVTDQDLKVEYEHMTSVYNNPSTDGNYFNGFQSNSIMSFRITTPDGTKYYFGRPPRSGVEVEPTEITRPFNQFYTFPDNGDVIASWYLWRVESADNLFQIDLNYAQESYSYYTLLKYPIPVNTSTDGNPDDDYCYRTVKNNVFGVRLKNISYGDNLITLIPGELRQDVCDAMPNGLDEYPNNSIQYGAKTLGTIRISLDSIHGGICKQFDFHYNYFYDDVTPTPAGIGAPFETDRKRLRLDSVQESSCDGSVVNPPYVFSYCPGFVPRRLNLAQDHWGFYNAATSNKTLIPSYCVTSDNDFHWVNGANRDSNEDAMKPGTLNKIIYPTGGFTEFEFEANTTWLDYATYKETLVAETYVGFGRAENPVDFNFAGSNNYFRYEVSSYGSPLDVTASVFNSSEGCYPITATTQTPVVSEYCKPGPGPKAGQLFTYNFGNIGGAGAYLRIYEELPMGIVGDVVIGGLRIKKITHNDGLTSNNIITNYSYQKFNRSTGILYSRPAYVQSIRNDMLKIRGTNMYVNGQRDGNGNLLPFGGFGGVPGGSFGGNGCLSYPADFIQSPEGIRPMENSQGNHIGYSEVKITQTGNGSSIYSYDASPIANTDDVCYRQVHIGGCDPSIPNYPSAPPAFVPGRGDLLYESHFSESGALLKTVNYASVYSVNPISSPAAIGIWLITDYSNQMPPLPPEALNYDWSADDFPDLEYNEPVPPVAKRQIMTLYDIYNFKKTKETIEENLYQPGNSYPITTLTTHYFDSKYHNMIARNTFINSKSETNEKKIKYSTDFRIAECDGPTDYEQLLTNSLNGCWQSYTLAIANCGNDPNFVCKGFYYDNLIRCQSDARKTFVSNKITSRSSFDNCVNGKLTTGSNDLQVLLRLQKEYKITPIEVTDWNADKLTRANYFDYHDAVTTNGIVYPFKVNAVNLAVPSTAFSPSTNDGSTVTKSSLYKEEANCKYDKGNLVEITDKKGVTTAYIYGVKNTLPIVKAVGIDYATLASAYQANINNPDNLRSYSTTKNSQITTYQYLSEIGMTSMRDSNGVLTTFEYDALGRLKYTKDKDGNIVQKYDYHYAN